jgi:hypothetical protein
MKIEIHDKHEGGLGLGARSSKTMYNTTKANFKIVLESIALFPKI